MATIISDWPVLHERDKPARTKIWFNRPFSMAVGAAEQVLLDALIHGRRASKEARNERASDELHRRAWFNAGCALQQLSQGDKPATWLSCTRIGHHKPVKCTLRSHSRDAALKRSCIDQ